MGQYSEIMQQLDDIKVQNAWLVKAVKNLLEQQFGIPKNFDLGEPDDLELEDYEGNVVIEDEPDDMSQFEHIAVRPQPKAKKCNHGHQVLVDGVVRCRAAVTRSRPRGWFGLPCCPTDRSPPILTRRNGPPIIPLGHRRRTPGAPWFLTT